MTPQKRMGQRRTKPLRKALTGMGKIIKAAGAVPLVGKIVKGKKTIGRQELKKDFKDMIKNVKARRKAGATDSSSRLKLETTYDRARKRKPSGRLNVDDIKRAANMLGLTPAQMRKKLKGN